MVKKQVPVPKYSKVKRILCSVLGISVILLLALQAAVVIFLYKEIEKQNTSNIMQLISRSGDSLYEPLVTEPQTGNRTIPALRLQFPAKQIGETGHYNSYANQEDGRSIVWLNASGTVMTAANRMIYSEYGLSDKQRWEDVPKFQACNRQVSLTFDGKDDQMSKDPISRGSKKLADGRTIYIFEDRACGRDANRLIEFVKQVESY